MQQQKALELIGKGLAVALIEWRGPSGFDAAATQLVHESAHRQTLLNVVLGIKLAQAREKGLIAAKKGVLPAEPQRCGSVVH